MKTVWAGTHYINLFISSILGLIAYSIVGHLTTWGVTVGLVIGATSFVILTEVALYKARRN